MFVLLQLHFARRAYESTWQARYSSDAKMHVAGYLVGVRYLLFSCFRIRDIAAVSCNGTLKGLHGAP